MPAQTLFAFCRAAGVLSTLALFLLSFLAVRSASAQWTGPPSLSPVLPKLPALPFYSPTQLSQLSDSQSIHYAFTVLM